MRIEEIISRYAAQSARPLATRRTGDWRAPPRKSLVREVEGQVRKWLFSLPEQQRRVALQQMEKMAREVALAEADMDSVTLIIDWSRGREQKRTKCPCRPRFECPLLFKQIGYAPDQDSVDRATPEELAQCPLQQPHELELRVIAPKGDIKQWWRRVKTQPAAGIAVCREGKGKQRLVDLVEGATVPQMMRNARRAIHRWRQEKGLPEGHDEVILLTPTVVDKLAILP